jgi:DNA-binding CsgD family transcriptional regulator
LEGAATLTLDPSRRAERALAAAQAMYQAGAFDAALGVLATAAAGSLNELQRARLDLLRGQIAFGSNRGKEAPPLLLAAAREFESIDVQQARDAYLEALAAALFVGRLAPGGARIQEVAAAARAAPPSPQGPRAHDLLLDGLTMRILEGLPAAAPTIKRALSAFRSTNTSADELMRWAWIGIATCGVVWDYPSWDVLSARMVKLCRETGALFSLPIALSARALVHAFAGEVETARSLIAEMDAVSSALSSSIAPYGALTLAAFRGNEAETTALVEASRRDVEGRGEGGGLTLLEWATAVLYNGLCRYEDALAAAERATEDTQVPLISNWAAVELVEAATRSGVPERATSVLRRVSINADAAGTDWALGVEARSRALAGDPEHAESAYREAIDRLSRTRLRVELARAHLLYGEWLRRQGRRRDAREQLRRAHELFTRFGMEAFAERARIELRATGEHARKRTVGTRHDLTPQEALIARLASRGASNPEIAGQLFISPATVAYHLRKVFTKLGVSSRRQLVRALPEPPT